MDASTFIQEVESIFSKYWGGHCEVVTTFFSEPRPREQLVAWLDLQLYKEIHNVPRMAQKLIELYEKLDSGMPRGEYEAEAYELADEVQHYRLLADVRELLTGEKPKVARLRPSLEQAKLEEIRRKGAEKGPLVNAVTGFGPGGGTAFGAAGSMIDGGPVERFLAQAFKVIYQQELAHYHKNRFVFDRLAREASPSDYPKALDHARDFARQHLILRNESFGYPLSAQRMAEIDAGKVVPFIPPRFV